MSKTETFVYELDAGLLSYNLEALVRDIERDISGSNLSDREYEIMLGKLDIIRRILDSITCTAKLEVNPIPSNPPDFKELGQDLQESIKDSSEMKWIKHRLQAGKDDD